MDPWVYKHERSLGRTTLVLGVIVWLLLLVGSFGLLLVYLLLGFVAYVFAHSALIVWLKGTAVRITPTQMPDLHAQLVACCERLGMKEVPEAYLLHGNGALNAFATRFLGRNFVVLLSDLVDAMERNPDGIHFYIGHELGHIRMKHLTGHLWRAPVLWLPLLGAAYSRAKESTCDLHGRACCATAESAAAAMVALAAGPRRWESTDLAEYGRQAGHNAGFWSSFHELCSGYPWLTKRVARVLDPGAKMPARNPFAYVLGLFVPYAGRAGGGAAGLLVLVAILAMAAAVAVPAYQDYTQRAQVARAWTQGADVRAALGKAFVEKGEAPGSLADAGVPEQLPDGTTLDYDSETMAVEATTTAGTLRMEPSVSEDDPRTVEWHCVDGFGLKPTLLPVDCRVPG